MALDEWALGVVPMLPPVRSFPGPLAEAAVRVSTQRALHGICRQAWLATQGLGIFARRYGYRVVGTLARLNSSIPSAVGLVHRPCGSVWCRRTSLHLQRCSFRRQRTTLCHKKCPKSPWCVWPAGASIDPICPTPRGRPLSESSCRIIRAEGGRVRPNGGAKYSPSSVKSPYSPTTRPQPVVRHL